MKRCLACDEIYKAELQICPVCARAPVNIGGYLAFAPDLALGNASFNPKLFEFLAKIEPGHFWFRSRNRILSNVLQNKIGNPSNILEIGCGTGFVLSCLRKLFPQARLSGSDIFTDGLALASKRVPEANLFQMDARRIPFFQEFDLIGAFDVLEHIEEDELVLGQIFQACKPGAAVLLTVPQHQWLWSEADEMACHQRRYERADLIRKVRHAGFEVTYVTSFVTLLVPIMWLSRRFTGRTRGVNDELKAAGLVVGNTTNKLLTRVMAIEGFFLKIGLRLPFGGSLLLLANRPVEDKVHAS